MPSRGTQGLILALELLVLALGITGFYIASTEEDDQHQHRYEQGDVVPLFVNKVGPLANPSETYQYYDLPFCRPDEVMEKWRTFGEVLNGDHLTNSLYELKFRIDKDVETVCKKTLNAEEVAHFRDAIRNDFYFQMHYDDLPFLGFVGKIGEQEHAEGHTTEIEISTHHPSSTIRFGTEVPQKPNGTERSYHLFKHVNFNVLYNENQVIEITSSGDPNSAVDISEDDTVDIEFTYSALWKATSVPFADRMRKYLGASSDQHQLIINWFSVISSIIIAVKLAVTLSVLYIPKIRSDIFKYSKQEDVEMNKEESGWRHLYGDVFRYPPHTSLFCAIMGSGTQLLTLVFLLSVLAFIGWIYPYSRADLYTSLAVFYVPTSVVAGYIAATLRTQLAGTGQEVTKCMFLTGVLYLGPLFITFSFLNTIALSYGVTAGVPFDTTVAEFFNWAAFIIIFLGMGGIIGYAYNVEFQAPCATRRLPRQIPPVPWHRKMTAQIFIGGLWPFFAIFIQLHFLYASMWGNNIFTVYTILFISFIVLIVITAIWSIGLTYYQLTEENHKWWWSSMLCGGSTAVFMYAYCLVFYARSNMSGLLQLVFFLGYNAYICYAFFLMLGTVAAFSSLLFVRRMYLAVKME